MESHYLASLLPQRTSRFYSIAIVSLTDLRRRIKIGFLLTVKLMGYMREHRSWDSPR
jgi:hypothetical protein